METERILLRRWLDSDAETLFRYASDPDVGPRAGWPPHRSVEESLEIIRSVFNRDTTTWAIVLKENNEVIGAMRYGRIMRLQNANSRRRTNRWLLGRKTLLE